MQTVHTCWVESFVPDPIFSDPRLASLYDVFDNDRSDLEVYAAMVQEFGASCILDVGCGTGTLACMLAAQGLSVVGVDPAAASLHIARSKLSADQVRWIHGDATTLPDLSVDLALMTGNVAQVFLTDEAWGAALRGVHRVLESSGRLVFEVRDPSKQAWRNWGRTEGRTIEVVDVGPVSMTTNLTGVEGQLVSFRHTYRFGRTGEEITSDSTLRFRERGEIVASLHGSGYDVLAVRDAPDRPGCELVFIARPTAAETSATE